MSKLKLTVTLLEFVFRWVGYPTPAPTLVFSAAPETKKGCQCIWKLKTIYWNLTIKHPSNMYIVKQCIRLCNSLLWSKRICPLPRVPRAPGRTQSSSPPLGFLSHLSSTGGRKCNIEHEELHFHEYRERFHSQIPKQCLKVTSALSNYFGSTERGLVDCY